MRIFLLLCVCVQAVFLRGEIVELHRDDHIIHGTLENGLSYYVLANANPEGEACLRLMVKVGSVYEQDDEKGIAHFVEHMVYRGSSRFKDGEIMQFLESQGAWLGADANAYTGFETTVYKVDLPIVTNERLEKTILIFDDLAFHAELSDRLIHKERRVVLDEIRQIDAHPTIKARQTAFSLMIRGTPYDDHYPAGHTQVVLQAPPETIRQFYHRWYRPDRMAVIAIGDFDADAVVEMIRRHFGSEEAREEILALPDLDVDFPKGSQASVYYDSNLTSTILTISRLSSLFSQEKDVDSEPSLENMKAGFASLLYDDLLEERLDSLCERYPEIFFFVTNSSEMISDYLRMDLFIANCAEAKCKEAMTLLSEELRRIVTWGFTEEAVSSLKEKYRTLFTDFLDYREETGNDEYLESCEDHFLGKSEFSAFRVERELMLAALEEVTFSDVNECLEDASDTFTVFLQTPSKSVKESIDADALLAIFAAEPQGEIAQLAQNAAKSFEVSAIAHLGSIVEESFEGGFHIWELSNGATVIFKPTSLMKNEIVLCAAAKGGYDLFPPHEIPSARLAVPYFEESGLGNLSARELEKFLDRKQIYFDLDIKRNGRTIIFFTMPDHLETAFQLIYEGFAAPRFDKVRWDNLYSRMEEKIKKLSNDPQTAFDDFVDEVNFQSHPLFRRLDVREADEEKAKESFMRMFGHPEEFTFILVGSMDEREARRYVETYLASIPVRGETPPAVAHAPYNFPQTVITERFHKGVMRGSRTVLTIPFDCDACLDEVQYGMVMEAALMVLERHLEAALRQRDGDTYGVSVRSYYPYYPEWHHPLIEIWFTSEEADIDKMCATVFQEIERLKSEPATAQEIATIKELLRSAVKKEGAESNWGWISTILKNLQNEASLDDEIDYSEGIAAVAPQTVQQAARCVFSSPNFTVLSHVSE